MWFWQKIQELLWPKIIQKRKESMLKSEEFKLKIKELKGILLETGHSL